MENKRLPGAYVLEPSGAVMKKQFSFKDAVKLNSFLRKNSNNNTYTVYFGLNGQEVNIIKQNAMAIDKFLKDYDSFDPAVRNKLLNQTIWQLKNKKVKKEEAEPKKEKQPKPDKPEKPAKKQRRRPKKEKRKTKIKVIYEDDSNNGVVGYEFTGEQAKKLDIIIQGFKKNERQ